MLTDYDLHLLTEGTHLRSYEKLGAHVIEVDGVRGTNFALWAPNAKEVSVIGDFNGWKPGAHTMHALRDTGFWELFIPGVGQGALYKFWIASQYAGYTVDKADPYGFAAETRPHTASRVWEIDGYEWHDQEWMEQRQGRNGLDAAMSIYEVHLGSWMRGPQENNRWLGQF